MGSKKPIYEELEQRITRLEKQNFLLQKNNMAHVLLDATNDAAYLIDPDGIFIMANKTAAAHLGTTVENMIGKSFKEFVPPEEIDAREEVIKRVHKEKTSVRLTGRRGKSISDYSVAPVLDENGDVYRIAAFARDITREKEFEKELLQNQYYMNILFNSTLSGVFVVDAEDHTIVDINKSALEMIGRNKEDVIGKVCHNFVCPAEKGSCPITDLGQIIDKSERKLITAHTDERTILKTVNPFEVDDKKYYIESFVDITELKEAEEVREKLISELSEALEKVKLLSGLMPICANCKKIRDDKGYWNELESFIEENSEASFSHGLCPHCAEELYGDQKWYIKSKLKKGNKED